MNDTAQMLITQDGDLVLLADDGKKMWSTNTAGKSVVGLNLTEVGNLVLYDRNDAIIWQSFDHPANTILPGQELRPGMKLTRPSYLPNEMARVYTFTTDDRIGFVVSVTAANSSQIYYRTSNVSKMKSDSGQVAALYKNVTFGEFDFHPTSSAQFIRLGPDGHLMLYVYDEYFNKWNAVDLPDDRIPDCYYQLACGSYGICSYGPQCQFPSLTKQIEERNPSSGCKPSSPISCDSLNNTFKAVENVTFFALWNDYISADISNTTAESCKQACLRKGCSCTKKEKGTNCVNTRDYYWSSFDVLSKCIWDLYSSKVRRNDVENDDLDLPKLQITRFPYEDLKAMTRDFTTKLGEGGFGSVFLGTLTGGVRIAVKRLDGFGQIKKSFLAEAGTIGTIHHVNLVRLLGFCAGKSRRLLVYEYMSNGSLDKWIFHKDQEFDICWQVRRKIILDIAKGLAYLHEECHQKIIHLDIKPQNILLDEHFNAKLADFGLSKLIDKDQIHVMTTIRGTPGYLAPEWLSSVITEKVDVYGFGIVMLEVLCGRKNVDRCMPSDEVHMLTLFKCKAEQGSRLRLPEMIPTTAHSRGGVVEGRGVALEFWVVMGDDRSNHVEIRKLITSRRNEYGLCEALAKKSCTFSE
ncbi:G-type lectin S-receptor-like serine/threonine-protein kinase SD2-2 [Syzygium oleosum]|uniref:G-type lectin S-receptor-like serine/threonine-protein kinase SD2-2 n=1 Tax=Syzygium oleosum TaxID=219896 RepID=UPI0024BA96D4|nr:G-type lectin S-receptor-like serine/threonine-protein kinase SD2-2 [Syzygium oleosum]